MYGFVDGNIVMAHHLYQEMYPGQKAQIGKHLLSSHHSLCEHRNFAPLHPKYFQTGLQGILTKLSWKITCLIPCIMPRNCISCMMALLHISALLTSGT
jgi:hypothetical protein